MAKYNCRDCQNEESSPRRYQLHFGERCRCPRCGTYRITKLKVRDKIDKMEWGVLNLFERLMGGSLYHCRFCRIQFYDRREFAPPVRTPTQSALSTPPESPRPITDEPSTATPAV